MRVLQQEQMVEVYSIQQLLVELMRILLVQVLSHLPRYRLLVKHQKVFLVTNLVP